jgi:class 3 adenylate cyclase
MTLSALTFQDAYATMQDVTPWVSVFVLLPVSFHYTATQETIGPYRTHVVETLLVPTFLYMVGVGYGEILLFVWLTLLCNVSLWGAYSLPSILSGSLLLLALAGVRSLDVVELNVAVAWTIGLAVIVHRQANQQYLRKEDLRQREKDILKFLPQEFDPKSRQQHQRQWLTVAFVDLGGFTAAVEQLAPEVVREVLNEFLSRVSEQIGLAGGSVGKFLGDGVLCTFASSERSERAHAAEKCVETVLSVLAWMPEFNRLARSRGCTIEFSLSVGVASGHCSSGAWGSGARMDYTVIGSPVNLACRLQAAAVDVREEMPILIDPTTSHLIDPALSVEGPHPISLKGFTLQGAFTPSESLLLKA